MDALITRLREVFADDKVNVEHVERLLSEYKSSRADWKKYAHYDPHRWGERRRADAVDLHVSRYTRNLVDVGNGKYNLMLLCWPSGLGSK